MTALLARATLAPLAPRSRRSRRRSRPARARACARARARAALAPLQVAEPTPAQIDEWHAKYMSEVRRLFEENKGSQPDYANKELVIH